MALSTQQEAIVAAVTQALRAGIRTGINVVARAGCGKTFTLVEVAKTLGTDLAGTRDEVQFGAYNKKIADEIKMKLAKAGLDARQIAAGTIHSLGFSAWRRVARDVKVDDKKVNQIVEALKVELANRSLTEQCTALREKLQKKATACATYGGFVIKAVSLAKQRAFGFLCSYEDLSKWYELSDHFGLEEELEEDAVVDMDELMRLCIHVYRVSLSQDKDVIDFDDMILAPLVHNAKVWPKRVVLLDEAQDTNPARRALALKVLAPNGVLVAVGDPAQAIYGFTGADADSMELIKKQLNSSELSLNVTYRCPKKVVALAQSWVPDITAHADNADGEVVTVDEAQFWKTTFSELTKQDAVLCRNTKPLVELAYNFLRKGIACRVEGREIGNGLIKLATRWKVSTLNQVVLRLETYKERECQKWLAKGMEQKCQGVEDQVETLLLLIERLTGEGKSQLTDLVEFIRGLFEDTTGPQQVLTLSTVHKSKGREWSHVVLWGRNAFMPSKYARKDWQADQEKNLMYVAVTRAMCRLTEVTVIK